MTINSWKNGVTEINENNMNALLSLQPFKVWYQGTKAANGTISTTDATLDLSLYSYRFPILASVGDKFRIELELSKVGMGCDVPIAIAISPSGSPAIASTIVPKEHLGTVSLPFDLDNTKGVYLILGKCGDASNKVILNGKLGSDLATAVKAADSWETNLNVPYPSIFSGNDGELINIVEGENELTTFYYNLNKSIKKMTTYIPPPDGTEGGVRNTINFSYTQGILIGGAE